jgi:hypothetical protein
MLLDDLDNRLTFVHGSEFQHLNATIFPIRWQFRNTGWKNLGTKIATSRAQAEEQEPIAEMTMSIACLLTVSMSKG